MSGAKSGIVAAGCGRRRRVLLAAASVSLALTGAVGVRAIEPAKVDPLSALRATIGTAPCSDDRQCRTLPVGHKACGGPEAYLAWSSVNADAVTLQRLAAARRNTRPVPDARFSTCSVVVNPGARCIRPAATNGVSSTSLEGTCRLAPRPFQTLNDK